ncbi:MAG: RagB/SusD family nutrient uptake outer membrane protein, partial [Alistipes sp.]|nr:RagB/SusD family nutrient uptake outer membrane protein [Alistipes sp.]
MKKFKLYIIRNVVVALSAMALFSACSLEEDMQSNYQTQTYYKSYAQCITGLNGCYAPFRSIYNGTFMLAVEAVSDLMYCDSGTYDAILDISPANPRFGKTMWTQGYLGVMRCNNVIAAIERAYADGYIKEEEYNALKAEGAALRGMYYYLLTSFFGDVPFYTTPVETMEDQDRVAKIPRMSAIETRGYIVDELLDLLARPGVKQERTYEAVTGE